MSGFKVIKAGVFTLIEDMGRFSFMHLGVTNSGFLDEFAALKAHKLLGNSPKTNLLEISFSGVKLEATADTTISITGAKCEFKIDKVSKNSWQTHRVKKGDILELDRIISGQRVYLAVKGGFEIKEQLNSSSTTIKENLGGLDGNRLKNGDFLPFKECKNTDHKRLKNEFIPKYEDILRLRVILSYQEDSFSEDEKNKFFNSEYTITPDFNRMACKLSGEKIESSLDGIVSEGISFGAIQIPKDGQPIILLKRDKRLEAILRLDLFLVLIVSG